MALALLMAVAAAVAWIHYPPARYAAQVNKILADRPAEMASRQSQFRNDSQSNMFLDQKFGEMWALPSQINSGQIQYGSVNSTMDALENFNPRSAHRPLRELSAFQAEKGLKKEDLQKARANFQKLLPDLKTAISKPYFVSSETRLSIARELPNFAQLRDLVRAVAFEAHLQMLEGKIEPALGMTAINCALQPKIQQGEPHVIGAVMAASLFNNAIEPIFSCEWYHHPVSDSALQMFEENLKLQEVPLTEDARCFEFELVGFHQTVAQGPSALSAGTPAPLEKVTLHVLYSTGIIDRECRLYDNDMLPIIEDIRNGNPVSMQYISQASPWLDDLRGKHGRLALEFLANYERAQGVLAYSRTLNRVARIFSAIKRYHNLKKEWPTKIEDLAALKFEIPHNPISSNPFSLQSGPEELRIFVPHDPAWQLGQLVRQGPLTEDGSNLTFTITKSQPKSNSSN